MEAMTNRVVTMLQLDTAPEPALIDELLRQGEALALSYTGRATLPPGLESALVRLAVVLYNRLGMEGEEARREGEVDVRLEALPEDIKTLLDGRPIAQALAPSASAFTMSEPRRMPPSTMISSRPSTRSTVSTSSSTPPPSSAAPTPTSTRCTTGTPPWRST